MQSDFGQRGIDNARLDADLLVAHALGVKRIALFLDPDRPLIDAELSAIRALVARRRGREPMAYILGEREFYGRAFTVTRDVLIPRPDTETLVDEAKRFLERAPEGSVLDLCTGSGAVGITLAAECAGRAVVVTDLSAEALAVATGNATRHELTGRVSTRHGDLFAVVGEGETFACITVNPPYIGAHELADLMPEVREFEPRMALDAGEDALAFYRRIARDAPRHLAPSGGVFVEVGIHQADAVRALFEEAGLTDVRVVRDLAGIERVVGGVYAG
ncbi:MAG: peptide chain release factor N(5)-glutamine methyltransferase [Polyangiales bacterium]